MPGKKKDTIKGTKGNDILVGDDSENKIDAGKGDDTISGRGGKDHIKGEEGNDLIDGGSGADKIDGGKGDDTIAGGDGNDDIKGGDGNDYIEGNSGNDKIDAGKGDNTVFGGDGNDDIKAKEGKDVIEGGAGNDKIKADKGDDTIRGGAGKDDIDAGAGDDSVYFNISDNIGFSNKIDGGSGTDTLILEAGLAEWMQENLQSDVANYLDYLGKNSSGKSGKPKGKGKDFDFSATGLEAKAFENLRVIVDGKELNPDDELVVADDDSASSAGEHSSVSGNVLDNDHVPDLIRSLELIQRPVKGQFVFSGLTLATEIDSSTGSYVYEPGDEFNYLAVGESEEVSFSYRVTDADGDSDTASVTITVTGTNDLPIATADNGAGEENETLLVDVLANDTDADTSDTHTIVAASIANGLGAVSIVNNQLQYIPGTDYDYLAEGEQTAVEINYTVQDNNGGTDTSILSLVINGSNDGPVAVADSDSTDENGSITVDVLASDTDVDANDTHTVDLASIAIGLGSVAIVNNKLDYTPGTDYDYLAVGEQEIVTIDYTMSDNHGVESSTQLTLTVIGTNDRPFAFADDGSADENETLLIDVLANDTDIDTNDTHDLTVATVRGGKGSALVVGNQLQFQPGTDFDYLAEGETTAVVVDYTMQDNNAAESSSELTLTLTGSNDGPQVAASLSSSASEQDDDFTVDLLAGATDVDTGASLSVSNLSEADGKGGWSFSNGVFTVNPHYFDDLNNDDLEVLTLNYDVTDEHGSTVPQSLTLNIEGFTDAPSLNVVTNPGSQVNRVRLQIESQPANNERVALSFSSLPAGAVILNAQSQNVSAGIADFSGSHILTLVLPLGEAIDGDLGITVDGIGAGGEVIGSTSDTVDLTIETHTSASNVNFSSVDQSMWLADTDAVIGWHEYVPIIGGVSQLWNETSQEWEATGVDPWSTGKVQLVSVDLNSQEIIAEAKKGPQQLLDDAKATFAVASVAVDQAALAIFHTAQQTFNQAVIDADNTRTQAFQDATNAHNQATNDANQAFNTARSDANSAFSSAETAANNALRDAEDTAQGVYDAAVAAGDTAAQSVFNTAQGAFDDAKATSQGVLDDAYTAYRAIADFDFPPYVATAIAQAVYDAAVGVHNAAVAAAQGVLNAAEDVYDAAQTAFKAAAQDALDTAFKAAKTVKAAALETAQKVLDTALDAAETVKDGALALAGDALNSARYVAENVRDLAVSAAQTVLDTAEDAYNVAKQAVFDTAQLVLDGAQAAFDNTLAQLNTIDFSSEVKVEAELIAEVGLQVDFELDLGSVDTDIDYEVTTLSQYNHTTDVLYLTPQLANLTDGTAVAFSTVSPNVKFVAALVYDVGANLDVFVDGHLKASGETVFDISPTSEGHSINTSVSTGGWKTGVEDTKAELEALLAAGGLDAQELQDVEEKLAELEELDAVQEGKLEIVNFDSTEVSEVEVPFIEKLTENILSVSLKFPTVETEGVATEYDPNFLNEGGFLSLDLSEITDSFMNLVNAKLDFSPEAIEAYNLSPLAEAKSLDEAVASIAESILAGLLDQLDGQSEETPLFLIDAVDESDKALLHVNAIPDSVTANTINDDTAKFGFYAAYGESDEVVKVNIDVDQVIAVIVNKIAEGALAAVTAGATAPATQAIPDINPLDLEIGIKKLLEVVAVPKATIDEITKYINLTAGFEAADIDVYSAWKFSQEFSLSIDDMSYLIVMEDGEEYVFSANSDEGLMIENASQHDVNGDGVTDYAMELVPTAMFSNDTELRLSIGYVIDFLKAKLAAGVKLPLADVFGIDSLPAVNLPMIDLNVGPLLRIQGDLDLVSADVFESRFSLDIGKDSVAGSFSVVDDVIVGTDADDVINAGQGNDILTGGLGSDIFIFGDSHGSDTINDFDIDSGDAIDLTAVSSIETFGDVLAVASYTGGNTELDLGDGSITLVGVSVVSLQADDFIV